MATSRSPTPPSTKRLLQELKATTTDPSPVLLSLAPVSEVQILYWEAVLKGVPGTAYEGGQSHYSQPICARIISPRAWELPRLPFPLARTAS